MPPKTRAQRRTSRTKPKSPAERNGDEADDELSMTPHPRSAPPPRLTPQEPDSSTSTSEVPVDMSPPASIATSVNTPVDAFAAISLSKEKETSASSEQVMGPPKGPPRSRTPPRLRPPTPDSTSPKPTPSLPSTATGETVPPLPSSSSILTSPTKGKPAMDPTLTPPTPSAESRLRRRRRPRATRTEGVVRPHPTAATAVGASAVQTPHHPHRRAVGRERSPLAPFPATVPHPRPRTAMPTLTPSKRPTVQHSPEEIARMKVPRPPTPPPKDLEYWKRYFDELDKEDEWIEEEYIDDNPAVKKPQPPPPPPNEDMLRQVDQEFKRRGERVYQKFPELSPQNDMYRKVMESQGLSPHSPDDFGNHMAPLDLEFE
eukprot:gnl/Trimastix_PCT/3595.p1 GENE.gnl/Trimastix_PCT/3595~~gnl/Trimastix_PCT/3595.p1  ORF type:complete len:373 (-),score=45.95 gnl/Trimastix_PCT/3595:163-1281(-)